MNTLSEIEDYYKKREQQLIEELHKQEAALAAANQKLKQLTENQRAPVDETAEQHAAREQKLKEELYRDPLTGAYNRRYYEEVSARSSARRGSHCWMWTISRSATIPMGIMPEIWR